MFETQLFQESNDFDMGGFGFMRIPSEDGLFNSLNKFDEAPKKESVDSRDNMVMTIQNLINKKSDHQVNIFKKKTNKSSKKAECGYNKNICGYITKKILRQFVNPSYKETVVQLCGKHGASYTAVRKYYSKTIERVTGPSHIPGLINPVNAGEVPLKGVFREFFEWFLRERYIRYLLVEGKMDKKQVYIRYKNETLLQLIEANDCKQKDVQDTENSSFSNAINIPE